MPARFVLRDNVLMYFNSPKDFTGFRDKPSVRPSPEATAPRRARGGCPEAARAPRSEPWVALAAVVVRSRLPGRAHRRPVVPCRHPSHPDPRPAPAAPTGQPCP